MNAIIRQFLGVFLTVCSLVIVWLAVTLPLGGHSTKYVSDLYYSAITPAGWAFSIWSLIYTGVIAFAVWQALPSQRQNTTLQQAAPWFWGSQIANAAWLFAWHYLQLPLSILIILVYLLCVVKVVEVFLAANPKGSSTAYWLGFVTFSFYAGWLTIATTANATVVLMSLQLPLGLHPEAWGVIILCVAFLIAFTVFSRWKSPAYFVVITWAFAAIADAHRAQMEVRNTALVLGLLALGLSTKTLVETLRGKRE